MALPNGGGGYQIGDGNLNEPLIDALPDPIVITAAASLTAVQVLNGILILNTAATTSNQAYTLPTVADLEAVLVNSDKVGTAFTFRVVNLGTSSGTATITTNTGWTLTGSLTMAVPVTSGAFFIARKSSLPGAASAWTLYRAA